MVSMLSDKYIGSYESPPFSSVMRFLPWQFSLQQVLPDVIQLPPLLSSSSPAHPSPSLFYQQVILLFSINSHLNLLSCKPYVIGYFCHLRCSSSSFIPYDVKLGDSTHPSQHRHLLHVQHLLCAFLHCPCVGTVYTYIMTLLPCTLSPRLSS